MVPSPKSRAREFRTYCRPPYCYVVVPRGERCPTCRTVLDGREAARKATIERERGSAHARGYGRAWGRLRLRYLLEHPWCNGPGCIRPATEVDHVLPKRAGGTDDDSNLQGLCKRCHSRKTAREVGFLPDTGGGGGVVP